MNERQARAIIANVIRLENLAQRIGQPILNDLIDIYAWLASRIEQLPEGDVARRVMLRQDLGQVRGLLLRNGSLFYNQLQQGLSGEVEEQTAFAARYLGGGDAVIPLAPAQLAIVGQVRVLGERLETLFRAGPDGQAPPWIRSNLKVINQVVERGFLEGQTNQQIARELTAAVGTRGRGEVRAVARTAVMDMSHRAQQQFWDANDSVIAGYEYDATMDYRVCPICAPWDGRTAVKRKDLPAVPQHPNCRCSLLPLTETELELRKERGPQRRTIVELVEGPKPVERDGVRVYARQVKINGKKYWRVARDIRQTSHPLTMGEFLQRTNLTTKSQVLGSRRRAEQFNRLVARDGISPDEALRRVTDFRLRVPEARRKRSAAALKPPRVRAIPKASVE